MKLHNLTLRNFRRFSSLDISMDENVIVFLGSNGGGKTSVLDGIAAALGGLSESLLVPLGNRVSHQDVRRTFVDVGGSAVGQSHYPLSAEVVLSMSENQFTSFRAIDAEDKPWARRPQSTSSIRGWFRSLTDSDSKELTAWPIFAYYKVGRGQLSHSTKSTRVTLSTQAIGSANQWIELAKAEQKTLSVSDSNDDLQRLGVDPNSRPKRRDAWTWSLDASADWKSTWLWWGLEFLTAAAEGRAVSPLCRAVNNAVVGAVAEGSPVPCWSASDRDILVFVPGEGMRPVGTLSDGFRSTVALFADLARRCAVLNPHLGDLAPLNTRGVVLIDEIDLHLHPEWQRRLVPSLIKLFPMIQFIVTTHSPQVVSSIEGRWVKLLQRDGNIVAGRDLFTKGRNSNDLLEDIFGVPCRPQETKDAIEQLFTSIDNCELDAAKERLDKLMQDLGHSDPDLVRANWMLEFEIGRSKPTQEER